MLQKIAKIVLVPFALLAIFFPLAAQAQIFGVGDPCGPTDPPCPANYACDTTQGRCVLSNPEEVGIGGVKTSLTGTSVVATSSVRDLVIKYVNFALPLLALAAFAGFVYAGFLFVVDFGQEEQVGKAKKIMMYSVIGLVLVILSYTIVQLFTQTLSQSL